MSKVANYGLIILTSPSIERILVKGNMWKHICGNMNCRNNIAEKEIAERSLLKGNMQKPSWENPIVEIFRCRKNEVVKESYKI